VLFGTAFQYRSMNTEFTSCAACDRARSIKMGDWFRRLMRRGRLKHFRPPGRDAMATLFPRVVPLNLRFGVPHAIARAEIA
jgi:hypothetical protein